VQDADQKTLAAKRLWTLIYASGSSKVIKNGMARPVWLTIGVLSFACGVLGVVLPLLPTTPFVLLSAYAFAQSSPRLHRWLIQHPRFGPMIRNWQLYGAIDRRTKIVAFTVMIFTPLITWIIGAPPWALAAQIVVLLTAATFIATRPDSALAKEIEQNK
jgi:uncharacterized membrane protein YbaN (DUF454 family)